MRGSPDAAPAGEQSTLDEAGVSSRERPRWLGTIDKVIVDVSGELFLDHEREVVAWISRD
jgi:hypothetical protein